MSHIKAAVYTGSQDIKKITKISTIPVPEIEDEQILVKSVAFAANPTDWKHMIGGLGGKTGAVVGSDVSGYVEKVGSRVTNFNVGDVVAATLRGNFSEEKGGFADYVPVDASLAIRFEKDELKTDALPVGVTKPAQIKSFEAAASLPLGLATIGVSFSDNFKLKGDTFTNSTKTILIWGGATSSGILAIQVAKLVYGLKVIATASSKHHSYLSSIGADAVFDYRDSDVISKIKETAKGNIAYALDTVSSKETFQSLYDATEGSEHVIIDNLLFLGPGDIKRDDRRDVIVKSTLVYLANGQDQAVGNGIVIPSSRELVLNFNEFWQKLLPPQLPNFKTAALKVLPAGLESVNEALELLYTNKVSGEKVVFRLE